LIFIVTEKEVLERTRLMTFSFRKI